MKLLALCACLILAVLIPAAVAQPVQDSAQPAPDSTDPTPDSTQPVETLSGDRIEIFGDKIHIREGQYLRGMIVSVGGDVIVDGEVDDQVVVILGSLTVRGIIDRDTVTVMSDVELEDAQLEGQWVHVLGAVDDRGSSVRGDRFNLGFGMGGLADGFLSLVMWFKLFHKLLIFLFLVALAAMAPGRIRVMGDEAPLRYLVAVFTGLATYLVVWALILLFSPTIVGSLAIWTAFLVVKWLGIAGLFFAIGRRLGRSLGRAEISILAGVLLSFVFYVLISTAPAFFGWPGFVVALIIRGLFFLLVEAPGVGIAVLSRLGRPADALGAPAPPLSPLLPPAAPPTGSA